MDLLDFHRGELSPRRLRVLIQHLPRESALVRALHGEEAEWGLTEQLLAATVDELAAGNWLFTSAHTAENADPPEPPRRLPRPGVEDEDPEVGSASPEQIAAFFGGGGTKG